MGAWDLVEAIRSHRRLKCCSIVLLLPAGHSEVFTRCRDLDVQFALTKPVKESELMDAVWDSLGVPRGTPRSSHAQPLSGEQRRLRILLAEDAPVNQEVGVGLLKLRGHEVEVVENGKQALAALKRETFDVVLMDLEMPEMDGLAATMAVRQHEETTQAHVPIIAMTAHAVKGFRERCIEAGMDGYISKPIQPAELYRALESAAARASPPAGEVAAPTAP
jgi:CheY-like chemotaxis protein